MGPPLIPSEAVASRRGGRCSRLNLVPQRDSYARPQRFIRWLLAIDPRPRLPNRNVKWSWLRPREVCDSHSGLARPLRRLLSAQIARHLASLLRTSLADEMSNHNRCACREVPRKESSRWRDALWRTTARRRVHQPGQTSQQRSGGVPLLAMHSPVDEHSAA